MSGNRSPIAWVTAAALVGFASSATFSSWLHLGGTSFVLAHAGVTLVFLTLFFAKTAVRPMVQLRRRWRAGVVVGLLGGAVLAYGVQAQVSSSRPTGGALIVALAWFGLVYGVVDAMLLTVVPILSVYGSRSSEVLRRGTARLSWGALSLLASLLVTAAYHLGFAEFRGPSLVQPLIGNAIVAAAYLLAGNPLAPIVAHVCMHVAAVLHGMATTTQLPPHY